MRNLAVALAMFALAGCWDADELAVVYVNESGTYRAERIDGRPLPVPYDECVVGWTGDIFTGSREPVHAGRSLVELRIELSDNEPDPTLPDELYAFARVEGPNGACWMEAHYYGTYTSTRDSILFDWNLPPGNVPPSEDAAWSRLDPEGWTARGRYGLTDFVRADP